MNLAAYLRVSTDAQADGLGLEVQETAIRDWAKVNGHTVDCHAADVGVSGSNGLEQRVALPEVFDWLKTGAIAGVVVYRLDRLARDLIIQEQLLAEVKRAGGRVFSTSASEGAYLEDDPGDPSRALIRQVLGAVAQYERSMIALRLRSGRQRKHDNGGFAFGSPPYGYRAEAGELVPVEHEQEAIALMREWRDSGCSYRAIAEALEVTLPARRGKWHPDTCRKILTRREPTSSG